MEILFTAADYVAWLKAQAAAKRPYWYGTFFQQCTQSLLNTKARQYPAHYTAERMPRYKKDIAAGQICGDCVNGAVKGAAWSELGTRKPVYTSHGVPDVSADGMFSWCKKKGMAHGKISTMPDKPGICLRCAGHVGVYIGDGKAVEWRGFAYGCVITEVKKRTWTDWYELPWVNYGAGEEIEEPEGLSVGARLLKKGATGEDVRQLQEILNRLGFDAGEADGEYGILTLRAVKRMQHAAMIDEDGEYGPESHKALMGMLAEAEHAEDGEETEEPAEKRSVRVTAAVAANIRAGAGKEYDILTAVKKGTVLPYAATAENGWIGVKLDDRIGWISPKMAEVAAA